MITMNFAPRMLIKNFLLKSLSFMQIRWAFYSNGGLYGWAIEWLTAPFQVADSESQG